MAAEAEFVVPASLAELACAPEGGVSVKQRTDVASLSAEEADELVERASLALGGVARCACAPDAHGCRRVVLAVRERADVRGGAGAGGRPVLPRQASSDSAGAPRRAADAPRAARSDFCTLPPGARARLVDSLCSNLSVLGSSCGMLDAAVDGAALGTHRSALKAYVFFLTHIVLASEAEAREAAPVAASKARTLQPNGLCLARPAGGWRPPPRRSREPARLGGAAPGRGRAGAQA